MLMSETGNRGAAGAVKNPAAVLGNQPYAVAADGLGRLLAQASMQHAAVAGAHDSQPFSAKYCDIAARRASVASRRRFAPTPSSMKMTAAPIWMTMPRNPPLFQSGPLQLDWCNAKTPSIIDWPKIA